MERAGGREAHSRAAENNGEGADGVFSASLAGVHWQRMAQVKAYSLQHDALISDIQESSKQVQVSDSNRARLLAEENARRESRDVWLFSLPQKRNNTTVAAQNERPKPRQLLPPGKSAIRRDHTEKV